MNEIRINIVRFVLLVLAQIFIFNHINFLGYVNPYPYLLFIALFPFNAPKIWVLLTSFLVGLTIDIFSDGGGINAISCIVTAYARPLWLRVAFGIGIEYNAIKIQDVGIGKKVIYLTLLILTHHSTLYLLEIFSFTHIGEALKKTLYSGVFTLVLIIIFMTLFGKKDT